MRKLLILVGCWLLAGSVAAQDISACGDFDPPDEGALFYVGLGDSFSARGQFADALRAYDCSIERDPSFAEVYVSRGITYAAQLNTSAALADYNQALELNDRLLAAYNNRGLLYSQEINYNLALADFNLLLSFDPTYTQAYHNRAMIYAAEGNYDQAIVDLQQAISLNPNFAPAHEAMGAIYLALAVQSYDAAEQINGRPAQFDAADALQLVLDVSYTDDPSIWFGLQEVDQVFEAAP